MNRWPLTLLSLAILGAAVALSQTDRALTTRIEKEQRNPFTHLRWNQESDTFQFAIVSDRTGSHRPNIFTQAVAKLNLLQPQFVVSVGDLIEGTRDQLELQKQWREFDGMAQRLAMPFFYVPGNHDVGNKDSAKFWEGKLGRRHYHFVYNKTLFLVLNTDDPPGSLGHLDKEQVAWAKKVLQANEKAHWTIVLMHRPLWNSGNLGKNGWGEVESALAGRPYTVFAGHVHHYQKFVRQGRNYYQLATTGGGSLLRGVDEGEFDHLVWVTMKQEGPVLANLMLESIQADDLGNFPTDEPVKKPSRKPTFPVAGKVLFEGTPIPGAQLLFQATVGKQTTKAFGVAAADGTFTLSTYVAHDGAPEGDYKIAVIWRQPRTDAAGKAGPNLLPPRYGNLEESGLSARIQNGPNKIMLELNK